MPYDSNIEGFFRQLRNAKAAPEEADKTAPEEEPQQIALLREPEGDVVARHISSHQVVGEYHQAQSGEIFFYGKYDSSRRWYVNTSIVAFRLAAAAFNQCCSFLCTRDEDDDAAFSEAVTQLRTELEAIEPLGDPKTSLWGVTLSDPDGGGLLSPY